MQLLAKPVTEKKQVRVGFYMRVSTAEQELEGYSPEFQKAQLNEHVKRKDYKGWYTKAEWHFFDQGSGSETTERKNLQRLMELVRNREIDIVLVWKIDRLSRNLSDLLHLFEEMDSYGVGFASVKEDLDFTGAIGKLIFQIFGALAEFERENIKMRTEEGKRASALAGNYVGGSIPFGYRKIPNPAGKGNRLLLVADEAKIVRQIFRWYVYEDKTSVWIALELNRIGTPKSQGNERTRGTRWYDATIRNMLGSEEYRGAYITNRWKIVSKKPKRMEERPKEEWIYTKTEPIVDDVLFYLAQEKLRRVRTKNPKRGGGQEMYMLRGKLLDMQTGKGFVGYVSTKDTKNYRRKQFRINGKMNASISIAAKPLEAFVWSYIEKAIDDPSTFLKLHKKESVKNDHKDALSEKLRLYEESLSKVNERIERVKSDFYESRIDDTERQEWLSKYEEQREKAFTQKQKVEAELLKLGQYDTACEDLKSFSSKFKNDITKFTYDQKQKIVELLVDRIEVTETGEERKAKVYFRFDPKELSAVTPRVEPSKRGTRLQKRAFETKREIFAPVINVGGGR